jgi:predicted RNase H-like HicB family nuclease
MTSQAIKLKVTASVPRDCIFQLEDDGWNGVCEEMSVTVRGSSFEDAKRKMEAAIQANIESALRKHSKESRKKVA